MSQPLSSLPVKSLVKDTGTTYYGKPIVFAVMEHGHSGDPDGSTALIANNIIALKCFDAKESNNSNSDRKSYGNNRYLYSNLLQWLNSDAAAGEWYVAQHSADAAPTNSNVASGYNDYDQEAGFLTNLSVQMKAALKTVTKRTARNTATDGGSYEDVSSKMFLLSNTEVGLSNENSIAEGSIYAMFDGGGNSGRIAYPTAEAVSNSEYTNSSFAASKAWYWWLRTPNSGSSYYVRNVYTDGTLSNCHAYHGGNGLRPACCVSSSILVSDEPDSDGAYAIQWNAAPVITTDASENLGDKNTPFAVTYSISDADNDQVSLVVKVDDETTTTLESVVLMQEYEVAITGEKLNGMTVGEHTIKITATDTAGNTSEKVITFNRVAADIAISGTDTSLGNKWILPEYTYSVTGPDDKSITVTEYVDDGTEPLRTVEDAGNAGTITFGLDSDTFASLDDEQEHKLTVKAVNVDGVEVYRYVTFTKLAPALVFSSKPIETDAAAHKIIVNVDYEKQGDPELKVEATNAAYNTEVPWENITEAVVARTAHEFTNTTFDDNRYGVAVRISIIKNAATERVYCNAFGLCFD